LDFLEIGSGVISSRNLVSSSITGNNFNFSLGSFSIVLISTCYPCIHCVVDASQVWEYCRKVFKSPSKTCPYSKPSKIWLTCFKLSLTTLIKFGHERVCNILRTICY
jgi:hypothetical protein